MGERRVPGIPDQACPDPCPIHASCPRSSRKLHPAHHASNPEVERFLSESFPPAPKVWVSKTCSTHHRAPNSWESQLISFAHREDHLAGTESLWLSPTVACTTQLSLQQGHYVHHHFLLATINTLGTHNVFAPLPRHPQLQYKDYCPDMKQGTSIGSGARSL